MTVIKEEVYTHRSLETGGKAHPSGLHGEAAVLVRRQGKKKGEHGPKKSLLGFSREGLGEAW